MATQKRIYAVRLGDDQVRLIRAAHPAQAISYVVRSRVECKVPSADELISAVHAGANVEDMAEPALAAA